MSPIQLVRYMLLSVWKSAPEPVNAVTPALSVPKPITEMALTTTKKMPPKTATPRIARGMSRRGFSVSSPSEAAASKPANERKPNTRPIESAVAPTPEGGLNTLSVKS